MGLMVVFSPLSTNFFLTNLSLTAGTFMRGVCPLMKLTRTDAASRSRGGVLLPVISHAKI